MKYFFDECEDFSTRSFSENATVLRSFFFFGPSQVLGIFLSKLLSRGVCSFSSYFSLTILSYLILFRSELKYLTCLFIQKMEKWFLQRYGFGNGRRCTTNRTYRISEPKLYQLEPHFYTTSVYYCGYLQHEPTL